jgi:hypothetical protein
VSFFLGANARFRDLRMLLWFPTRLVQRRTPSAEVSGEVGDSMEGRRILQSALTRQALAGETRPGVKMHARSVSPFRASRRYTYWWDMSLVKVDARTKDVQCKMLAKRLFLSSSM